VNSQQFCLIGGNNVDMSTYYVKVTIDLNVV